MTSLSVSLSRIKNFRNSGPAFKITSGNTSLLVTTAGGKLHRVQHNGEQVVRSNSDCLKQFPGILGLMETGGWDAVQWPHVNTPGGNQGLVGPQGELYGSHVPYPDLALGQWTGLETANGLTMTSPADRFSGLQMERTFTLLGPNAFVISSSVRNQSHNTPGVEAKPFNVAPWDIFQLDVPTEVLLHDVTGAPQHYVFPEPPQGTIMTLNEHSFRLSLNPNKNMAAGEMYKFGYNFLGKTDLQAFALAVMAGHQIALKIDAPISGGTGEYLDGYAGQIYWCNDYMELENTGRREVIEPGQTTKPLSIFCALVPNNGNLLKVPGESRTGNY